MEMNIASTPVDKGLNARHLSALHGIDVAVPLRRKKTGSLINRLRQP